MEKIEIQMDDKERVLALIEAHHLPILNDHMDAAEVLRVTTELDDDERKEISSFYLNHPEVKNLKIYSLGLALINAGIFKESDLPLVCKKILDQYDPKGFFARKDMLAPKNGLEIFLKAHSHDLDDDIRTRSAGYLYEVLDSMENSKGSAIVGENNERDIAVLLSKLTLAADEEQVSKLKQVAQRLDQKYVERLSREQDVGYAGKYLRADLQEIFPESAKKAYEFLSEQILLKSSEANYFIDHFGEIYQYPNVEELLKKALTHPEVSRKFLDRLMSDREPWRDEEWVEDNAIFASTTLFFDHRMVNFKYFDPKVREDSSYRSALIEKLLDSATSIREDISSDDIIEILKQKPERIEEVISAINTYRITSAIPELSPSEIEHLRQKLDSITPEVDLAIINLIFRKSDSKDIKLKERLSNLGYDLKDLPAIFNKESILGLIGILADYPSKHTFALGVLLTLIKINDLPEDLIEKIKPQLSDVELQLLPDNGEWYLCSNAERYLKESLEDGAVIEINDSLIVKFKGKQGALCTKTFTTKDGFTFLEGVWYSPVDKDTIAHINGSFDIGLTSITVASGEWAFMRPGADFAKQEDVDEIVFSELLALTRQKMSEIKEHPPQMVGGYSRKYYREEYQVGGRRVE